MAEYKEHITFDEADFYIKVLEKAIQVIKERKERNYKRSTLVAHLKTHVAIIDRDGKY